MNKLFYSKDNKEATILNMEYGQTTTFEQKQTQQQQQRKSNIQESRRPRTKIYNQIYDESLYYCANEHHCYYQMLSNYYKYCESLVQLQRSYIEAYYKNSERRQATKETAHFVTTQNSKPLNKDKSMMTTEAIFNSCQNSIATKHNDLLNYNENLTPRTNEAQNTAIQNNVVVAVTEPQQICVEPTNEPIITLPHTKQENTCELIQTTKCAKIKADKSWFGFLKNLKPKKAKEMILPDDTNPTIIWNNEKKCWFDKENVLNNKEDVVQIKPPIYSGNAFQNNLVSTPMVEITGLNQRTNIYRRNTKIKYKDVLNG